MSDSNYCTVLVINKGGMIERFDYSPEFTDLVQVVAHVRRGTDAWDFLRKQKADTFHGDKGGALVFDEQHPQG